MGLYTVIDQRAFRVLRSVATDFEPFAPIDAASHNRIHLDGHKLGVDGLEASYRIINKWMGRVYVYTWKWSLPDDSVQSDIVIKCKYSGKMGSRVAQFVSKQDSALLQRLNRDKEILALCNAIDYEAIELRYSREERRWHVEMKPNYGDFIWILFPPVRYARKPKQQEMDDTMRLIKRFAQKIKQSIK
ncbi:hypothetical protein EDM56_20690 [Brevibacillus fluminis]|uniref:DUF3156 family protein n=1 Tax=Brevibacillus fluminis TaxID=511487 RepID=A0A3M8D9G8_9BACL|nr:hypothetical protein [Brevibacillus fluminis]RNB84533.1 hypothetical protein EDM56_20690 [Brevibacillus fluminis]